MNDMDKWKLENIPYIGLSVVEALEDIILKANVPETGQTITLDYEVDYE